MQATMIAAGEGWAFWLIGADVWRSPEGTSLDSFGLPMGRRWECSASQWELFRDLFSWAADV